MRDPITGKFVSKSQLFDKQRETEEELNTATVEKGQQMLPKTTTAEEKKGTAQVGPVEEGIPIPANLGSGVRWKELLAELKVGDSRWVGGIKEASVRQAIQQAQKKLRDEQEEGEVKVRFVFAPANGPEMEAGFRVWRVA